MYYHTKEVLVVGVYNFCFSFNNKILNDFHEEFRPRAKILKQLANPTAHVLKLNIGVVSYAYPNLKSKIIKKCVLIPTGSTCISRTPVFSPITWWNSLLSATNLLLPES